MELSVSHNPVTDKPNLPLGKNKRWMLRGTRQKK